MVTRPQIADGLTEVFNLPRSLINSCLRALDVTPAGHGGGEPAPHLTLAEVTRATLIAVNPSPPGIRDTIAKLDTLRGPGGTLPREIEGAITAMANHIRAHGSLPRIDDAWAWTISINPLYASVAYHNTNGQVISFVYDGPAYEPPAIERTVKLTCRAIEAVAYLVVLKDLKTKPPAEVGASAGFRSSTTLSSECADSHASHIRASERKNKRTDPLPRSGPPLERGPHAFRLPFIDAA